MRTKITAAAVALLASATLPLLGAPAAQARTGCGANATVMGGQLSTVVFDSNGMRTDQTKPYASNELKGVHIYVADKTVELATRGNHYRVEKDSRFIMGCYGHPQHPHVLFPRLFLDKGQVHLDTNKDAPGGIETQEGLIGPNGFYGQSIEVSRTWANKLGDIGTTVLTSNGPAPFFTPEMGATAGHCIFFNNVTAKSYHSNNPQLMGYGLNITKTS